MKTVLFKQLSKLSLIAGLILSVAFTSCKPERPEHPNVPPTEPAKCELTGQFIKVACGVGFYNDYWIKLDNGTLLMPCEVDSKNIPVDDVYEGMRVVLGYVEMKECHNYDDVVRCKAMVPEHTIARITCLEAQGCFPPTGCKTKGVLVSTGCGASVLGNFWIKEITNDQTSIITYIRPCQADKSTGLETMDLNTLKDGTEITFNYEELTGDGKTCPGPLTCHPGRCDVIKVVRLTCFSIAKDTPPVDDPAEGCTETGILHDKRGGIDGCGWIVELSNGEILDVGNQIDATQYHDKESVRIGYKKIYTGHVNTCMHGTEARITCIMHAKINNIR